MTQRPQAPNPLTPPRVIGLDAGHRRAAKRHRWRRLRGQVSSFFMVAIGLGVLAAAGYVGYTIYTEQQANDRAEQELRYVEIQREQEGRTTADLIGRLDSSPRWNGDIAPGLEDGKVVGP